MTRTLGLDLGTNSIGWALVSEEGDALTGALEGCGVRIFEEAVDARTRTPKNKARRDARLARRVLQRRARRRALLRTQLADAGLLPQEIKEATDIERVLNETGDPYRLRAKALDEPLGPHELGRVLLHLCARRGFLSNRKVRWGDLRDDPDARDLVESEEERQRKDDTTGRSDEEKEEGKLIEEIAGLWNAMRDRGARTLGEYLAGLPRGERKRARHTDRRMYEEEFEAVWNAQAEHHEVLDDGLMAELHRTIFHQRLLKLKGGRIGNCSLEPLRPRAAKARLESQRFRLLHDVNILEVAGVFRDDHPISQEQRARLAGALETRHSMTWGGIRRLLGLPRHVKFNLEEGSKDKGLTGNRTAARLRGIVPEWWDASDDAERKRLVEDLLTIGNKRVLFRRLREHWGFERETAFRLAVAEFEDGYANLSVKAMARLLPHMENGKRYSDARVQVGYGYEPAIPHGVDLLPAPPDDLRNPVVEKALHEVRKVVNAVIRQHGKPDVVRVELARDLKMTRKAKANFERQQKENQRMNEKAREELARIGVTQPSRDDLIKYRLWEECGHECPYTGTPIPNVRELFGPDVDVEHIIPYSRCLDDSFLNKTLCMAVENRQVKRNRTPHEAYDAAKLEEIAQRVKGWPAGRSKVGKLRKFTQADIPELDAFVSRQLTDTGYISRAALDYLGTLGVDVEVTKGRPTAMLRHAWGLNRILAGDSPDADAVAEKNRSDHRHHALDAAVVAVTGHSVYQRIARIAAMNEDSGLDPLRGSAKPDMPWDGFDHDLENAIADIAVSHAPLRKLHGALHEDTAFGYRYVPDVGKEQFVYRKRLEDLTDAMVDKIVDTTLRDAVRDRVRLAGGKVRDAFKDTAERPFFHPKNPDGQPVRRVRIYENKSPEQLFAVESHRDKRGGPFKYHAYGSNHHVEIFRNANTGKVESRFVTMMEAAKRARRNGTPIVDCEMEGCEFLMALSINDMVELDEGGVKNLYRVQQISGINNNLVLRHHRAARLDDNEERVNARPHVLVEKRNGRKVDVTPLGEVAPT